MSLVPTQDLAIDGLASPQQLLDEKEKKALATVMQDPEVVIMKQDLIKRMKDMKDKMLEKMIAEMFPKEIRPVVHKSYLRGICLTNNLGKPGSNGTLA